MIYFECFLVCGLALDPGVMFGSGFIYGKGRIRSERPDPESFYIRTFFLPKLKLSIIISNIFSFCVLEFSGGFSKKTRIRIQSEIHLDPPTCARLSVKGKREWFPHDIKPREYISLEENPIKWYSLSTSMSPMEMLIQLP